MNSPSQPTTGTDDPDPSAPAKRESFASWYATTYPPLLRALYLIAGGREVATELAAEAFTRALERWDRVGAMASPEGWTYRVAVNLLRRRSRRDALERVFLLRQRPLGGEAFSDHQETRDLWAAVRGLPERERLAVVLTYFLDLSSSEVATIMSVKPGTVSATLHSARQHLTRALLEDNRD